MRVTAASPGESGSSQIAPSRIALLLLVVLTAVYASNFRMRGAGDSFPVRVVPFSILREGNVDLNEFTWAATPDRPWPYYIHGKGEKRKGRKYYSVSSIATSIVVTPLYVLPSLWLSWNDIPYVDSRARVVMVLMEKLSAALLTALSAVVLYWLLRGLVAAPWPLALSLVYALTTCAWAISSQALWPHALSALCLGTLMLILDRGSLTIWRLVGAALVCATMVANRPQMLIFAGVAVVYLVARQRRLLVPFLAVAAVAAAALLAYNLWALGNVFGGYGKFDHFSTPFLEGVAGLLVSPNRGVFVYTPILLFSLWGIVEAVRGKGPSWLRYFAVGLLLHVTMYAKFDDWHAGYTYGPRYFADVLPLLVVYLVYGLVPVWRSTIAARTVAGGLIAYGFVVQVLGVYAADDGWNRYPISVDTRPERVWDWDDTQIGRAWSSGFKGLELLPVMVDVFTDEVPARLVELKPEDLASRIAVAGVPQTMRPGETRRVYAEVSNRGNAAWPMFSGKAMLDIRHLVFLVQSWRVGGRQISGIGEVVLLPENVAPGESVRIEMPLAAPPRPGVYDVEFRITQAIDGFRGVPSPDGVTHRIEVR